MDGEDDVSYWENSRKGNQSRSCSATSDLGDMSFMMLDYLKDAMKVGLYKY